MWPRERRLGPTGPRPGTMRRMMLERMDMVLLDVSRRGYARRSGNTRRRSAGLGVRYQ